jgi:hypothetical protein
MPQPPSPHRFGPLRLVLVFGLVSGLAGFVYEGARSIVSGRWSDRSGRYWAISIAASAITVVSVPLLGVGGPLAVGCLLVVAERFGKAVRTPASWPDRPPSAPSTTSPLTTPSTSPSWSKP